MDKPMKSLCFFAGIFVTLFFSQSCSFAEEPVSKKIDTPVIPTGVWVREKIVAPRASIAPKIDGDINDEVWKSAFKSSGFYRFGGNAPVTDQTEAWIIADKDTLYIAFHCIDSEPEKIRASETQRGGDLEQEDHVTVSLDSQGTRRGFSSFLVSAIGTQQDFREGGTADNISWAGDWTARAKRVSDGWTAEIAIPFRLLRYPKGCKSFGILFSRRQGREASSQVWPYVPSEGQMWEKRAQYLHDLTGIAPPSYAAKPTFLPYTLFAAGDDGTAKLGMDIKYPITTTLTGVVALNPDFRTVEQAVADINFSYNEQFVEDRRPFFAEGGDYLPDKALFYSRRIEAVDEGLKFVGRNGLTTVGILGAANQKSGKQRQSLALNLAQDIGLFNVVGVNFVADDQRGQANNRVGRIYGKYGIERGGVRYSLFGAENRSELSGEKSGSMENVNLKFTSRPGRLNGNFRYNAISPNFTSRLGYLPDVDQKGYEINLWQWNDFDKGPVEHYEVYGEMGSANRFDNSFFNKNIFLFGEAQNRRGYGVNASLGTGQRQENQQEERFHDRLYGAGFSWNNKTLFQKGGINLNVGRQAGENYQFVSAHQGAILKKGLSLDGRVQRQVLGSERTNRLTATGTYRIDGNRAISGRLIQTTGKTSSETAMPKGTNFYVGYSQRMPRGTDIYFLIGDPNATSTRNQVTLKLLRPF